MKRMKLLVTILDNRAQEEVYRLSQLNHLELMAKLIIPIKLLESSWVTVIKLWENTLQPKQPGEKILFLKS
jgi:hypothetical protein